MKMTIELDNMTAGALELFRVARAVNRTKEIILNTEAEIARGIARIKSHVKLMRENRRAQMKRLKRQQAELKRQLARHKTRKPDTKNFHANFTN